MREIEEERGRKREIYTNTSIHSNSRQKEIGRVEWDDEQTTTTLLEVGISISSLHHHQIMFS